MVPIFKKLIADVFVYISKGFGFKKLQTDDVPIPMPPLTSDNFDLRIIGLTAGTYELTVTACSSLCAESDHSNMLHYTTE